MISFWKKLPFKYFAKLTYWYLRVYFKSKGIENWIFEGELLVMFSRDQWRIWDQWRIRCNRNEWPQDLSDPGSLAPSGHWDLDLSDPGHWELDLSDPGSLGRGVAENCYTGTDIERFPSLPQTVNNKITFSNLLAFIDSGTSWDSMGNLYSGRRNLMMLIDRKWAWWIKLLRTIKIWPGILPINA